MKVLKGILVVILALIPWAWTVFFNLVATPVIGNFWGQITVGLVAAVILTLGIRAAVKGYGRTAPQTPQAPQSGPNGGD